MVYPSSCFSAKARIACSSSGDEVSASAAAGNISMYAVVIEKLVSSWLHQEAYGNVFATILQPLYLLVGSLVLAFLLARTCTFFYRRLNMQDEHSFVALFGLVLLAIALAHLFKLSTILALLAAGIIVKNHEARPQLWPRISAPPAGC